MRVLLVTTLAPFIRGGAEIVVESLEEQLRMRGVPVETASIPFQWHPEEQIARHLMACRLMRLFDASPSDLVIAFKFPAYIIPARQKKVWLLHQFRQAYDLWNTPYQDFSNTARGSRIRDMVRRADELYLGEAKERYTISQLVADRLQFHSGLGVTEVLPPPLRDATLFRPGEYGDYVFFPSRQTPGKRQHLAIEAMRHVRSGCRLVLAGMADTAAYGQQLRDLVAQHGLEDRVAFLDWISEESKASYMAEALGCLFIPYNEDYGLVTLEAFHSRKAVVTCTDSGGPNEFVVHEHNGLVVAPDPVAIAAEIDRLAEDRVLARRLGRAAFATIDERNLNWAYVVERLLG